MCAASTSQHPYKSNPNHQGVRAIQLGVIADLCLTGLKLTGGWAFEFSSLASDGWYSASDLVMDTVALAIVWASQRVRATSGDASTVRILECTTSLTASSVLVVLGLHMTWENMTALKLQFFLSLFSPDS
jgi:divalent metal cation (Fe/Co/Zn/Cd) transporter